MRTRRSLIRIFVGVLCGLALVFCALRLGPWFKLWRDFKNLERQATGNLDPVELQEWAMNLFARDQGHWHDYVGTNFYSSTNFPSGLRKIGLFSHGMHIITDYNHVKIIDDKKGGSNPHLEIGSPSYTPQSRVTFIQWKPGIYLIE